MSLLRILFLAVSCGYAMTHVLEFFVIFIACGPTGIGDPERTLAFFRDAHLFSGLFVTGTTGFRPAVFITCTAAWSGIFYLEQRRHERRHHRDRGSSGL